MSATLDYAAAAAHLGVSERQVRKLVAERRIAHLRIGRSVRFSTADLDAFLASCRVEPVVHRRTRLAAVPGRR